MHCGKVVLRLSEIMYKVRYKSVTNKPDPLPVSNRNKFLNFVKKMSLHIIINFEISF